MHQKIKTKLKKLEKHHYGLFAVFLFLLSSISLFYISRGETPYTSELSYTEHSVNKEVAGSVVPASCDSFIAVMSFKGVMSGTIPNPHSHFLNDCTTTCPSGHGTHDPYLGSIETQCLVWCPDSGTWIDPLATCSASASGAAAWGPWGVCTADPGEYIYSPDGVTPPGATCSWEDPYELGFPFWDCRGAPPGTYSQTRTCVFPFDFFSVCTGGDSMFSDSQSCTGNWILSSCPATCGYGGGTITPICSNSTCNLNVKPADIVCPATSACVPPSVDVYFQ